MSREHRPKTESLKEAVKKYKHVFQYVESWLKKHPMPEYRTSFSRADKNIEFPNIIYPVGDPIFIHIFKLPNDSTRYFVIEPNIDAETEELYEHVLEKLIDVANAYPVPTNISEMAPVIEKLIDDVVKVGKPPKGFMKNFQSKLILTQEQYDIIKYNIIRNRIGYGKLEPVFLDPNLEDIHCTGVGTIKQQHKIFDLVRTNIEFKDDIVLNKFIVEMTERVERPASDSQSVVDAMMPDGSRGNFIYGRDVSLEGSSFTLRKFSEVPVSITQIINWGTMSSQLAAYLWICLEHGMNLFVCGETASGKTTSLNAICTFIKPDDKIYTVENTPEVTMPHDLWQHLLTREAGKSTDVTYGTLLIAALRSRPNYIIVGEIRGEEGNVAFQAMQCIRDGNIIIPNKGLVDIQKLFADSKKKYGLTKAFSNSKQGTLQPKETVVIEHEKLPVFVSDVDGKIIQSIITHIHKMPKSLLIKIELDTGEVLEVTANHKWITDKNAEISAEELANINLHKNPVFIKRPKSLKWNNADATMFDFLDAHRIKKTKEVLSHIGQFKKVYNSNYSSFVQDFNKTDLQDSSKSMSFALYKKILLYLNKPFPKTVSVVIKGKIKSIVIPSIISTQFIKSIALFIQQKTLSQNHHDICAHILQLTPQSIALIMSKFSENQLSQLQQHLDTTSTIAISDKLWYSIGRLYGDDSLYIHKDGSFKDFRWQIKNKSFDEGILYAKQAIQEIPHTSVNAQHIESAYCTRLLGVSDRFVDYLIKNQFISLDFDSMGYSKAVLKHIPVANIANKYAFLAGLLDSDATLRYSSAQRTHEIRLALNVNLHNNSLLFSQLDFIKTYEHTLFPKITYIEFRYPKRLESKVKDFEQYCKNLGLKVRLSKYDKSKGIGARAEFSSKSTQNVFATWRDYVAPYMFRKDKIAAIGSISKHLSKLKAPFKNDSAYYYTSNTAVSESVLMQLATIATISQTSLICDNIPFRKKRRIYFKKTSCTKVISAKHSVTDYTYDISMKEKMYYIGGKYNTNYVYDTGHPVMATFHAGNPRTMIQRLTGQPINVPITFIDNLNISLIQMAVMNNGKMLRRVLDVTEIERYYAPTNQVVTRQVFQWDPSNDSHIFKGMYNSFILEKKIAMMAGYIDTREIYVEMKKRAYILDKFVELKLFNYYDLWEVIKSFFYGGDSALPFEMDFVE